MNNTVIYVCGSLPIYEFILSSGTEQETCNLVHWKCRVTIINHVEGTRNLNRNLNLNLNLNRNLVCVGKFRHYPGRNVYVNLSMNG